MNNKQYRVSVNGTLVADARSIAPVSYDIFDRNKLLLNCRNGTFSLFDMTFRAHNPADYITKMANVKYDPKAKCKRWDRFINEVMSGDMYTARYLQKCCGYAISGSTEFEKLFVLHGASARNGKSTLTETLSHLLGDYAKSCAAATISHRTTDGTKLLTRDLFQCYCSWLKDTGLRALSVQQFVTELRNRYTIKRYGAVGKAVIGIDWRKS